MAADDQQDESDEAEILQNPRSPKHGKKTKSHNNVISPTGSNSLRNMPMTEEYETDQAPEENNTPDQSFSKVQKKKKKQMNDAQFVSNEAFNTVEKNNHRKRADSSSNKEVVHSRNQAVSMQKPALL